MLQAELAGKCRKAAKMQHSLATFTPLQEFLQNRINFLLNHKQNAKIGENNALLQEFNNMRVQVA
ncbi:hypothetical protein [Paenibacillus dendritiformis]|uniref:hypothetical protein n=1 Tax=Paenibacillus dendritiformis TaxID=130049 RepID=UPI0018CFAD43|nr:hypothetical protein [Paenibacillus dendritiformis]